jgi:HK97 family phage portal protein
VVFLSGGVARGTASPPVFGGTDDNVVGRVLVAPSEGIQLTTAFATYGKLYERQLWVSTLVNKLAFGTARLPFKVRIRTDKGREDARDSDFGKLMRAPNPSMDPFFFWLWTSSTYDVCGEAIWVKIRPRPGAAPTQLWPMHPTNISTERDDKGLLWYVWRFTQDRELRWPQHDVVHFKTYNPKTTVRGLSRLEPLRATLLNEDAIRRAQAAFWKNGARPSVLLEHPKELSEEAAVRVKASWQSMHAGIDSWGKTAVLEEGMKPHVVQLSSEEMQMIESRKVNREEACALYDVPPPVVQILDRATFSNITENMRSQYRDTQAPRLGLFESAIEHQLRPDFDPTGALYGEFLMDEVLRGDFETRQAALRNADYMTIAEKREIENLPFVEGTDRIFLNAAVVPMSAPAEGDAPAAPPFQTVGLPALIEAGVLTEQDARNLLGIDGTAPGIPVAPESAPAGGNKTQRTVMGRLSRVAEVKDVDAVKLVDGLTEEETQVVLGHVSAALVRGDDMPTLRRLLNADLAEGDSE